MGCAEKWLGGRKYLCGTTHTAVGLAEKKYLSAKPVRKLAQIHNKSSRNE